VAGQPPSTAQLLQAAAGDEVADPSATIASTMVDDSTLAGSGFASAAANDPEQLQNCTLDTTTSIWPPSTSFLTRPECAFALFKMTYNSQSKRCRSDWVMAA
jgi:hypothetical protein